MTLSQYPLSLTNNSLSLDLNLFNLLQSGITASYNYLTSFANDTEFTQKMAIAFGNSGDPSGLQTAWLNGDFSSFPPIEVRYQHELNGAFGAYGSFNGVIYLSYEYLQQLSPPSHGGLGGINPSQGGLGGINPSQGRLGAIAPLTALLLEEYGHHVDGVLNGNMDSAGDEGDIFSRLVRGESISASELAALQAENDQGNITVNGVNIAVEMANITGTNGDDSLVGTSSNDNISGLEGNDTLEGGDGNDILDPGIGSDSVVGGSGSDRLVFDRSSETADVTIIYTDSNVDATITGGVNDGTTFREIESVDELRLGSGNDNLNLSGTTADQQDIYSGEGNDTVVGGSSRDRIRGEDGDDSLVGGAGNDSLYGQEGNDTLEGEDGNDDLFAGSGNDTLEGGQGNDDLSPGTGADDIDGGDGTNDSLNIDNRNDTADTTIIYTDKSSGSITGGSNDGTTFRNIERISLRTGSGNDNINLSAADYNTFWTVGLYGGSGNDTPGFLTN